MYLNIESSSFGKVNIMYINVDNAVMVSVNGHRVPLYETYKVNGFTFTKPQLINFLIDNRYLIKNVCYDKNEIYFMSTSPLEIEFRSCLEMHETDNINMIPTNCFTYCETFFLSMDVQRVRIIDFMDSQLKRLAGRDRVCVIGVVDPEKWRFLRAKDKFVGGNI